MPKALSSEVLVALQNKYVLSLDLKTDSESALITVSGNEFQTVGPE